MPELPEVETVRRQLAECVTGCTIRSVEQVEPAMLRDCSEGRLRKGLPGRSVENVGRRGKFLVVALDGGQFLTLHLGMTGQLLFDSQGDDPHTRFLFGLETADGGPARLEFRDTRKFGRVHFTTDGPAPRLAALGPDAWRGPWDAGYLEGRLRGRTAPVKSFLLDQRHLAGIGNIYADEILWWSELSPLRPAGALSASEVVRLAEEIPTRLEEGVRLLGCSVSDFVDTAGQGGSFQDRLRAYGKQGQTCSRCGGAFVRVLVSGRGTSYCPDCQH